MAPRRRVRLRSGSEEGRGKGRRNVLREARQALILSEALWMSFRDNDVQRSIQFGKLRSGYTLLRGLIWMLRDGRLI
jgi:hypothetical protein